MISQGHIDITTTSAWRNDTPLVRFGLLNVYQNTIARTTGLIIHLICKLQILALYLKVTLEAFSITHDGVSQVARYFTETFLFADFFDIQGQSSASQVIFSLISGYYLLSIMVIGVLFYKALRKSSISSRIQNLWAYWIYLHLLIILLPTFTFNSAILNESINNNLEKQSMIVLPAIILSLTIVYLGLFEIFFGSSMNPSNYLFTRNNLVQRFEAIEKCCLSVILYVIPDPETKYWIAICLNFVIALLKIPYILRNLPYYERSVLNQEIFIDSLAATLATLNLLAKVIGPSDYTNPLSIIIIWVLLSLLAAKISLSRLHKLLSNLMNARPEEVRFSHLPKKLHLYEDYLRMRNHVNLDAQYFDYYNLVLLGREKSISTTEEGKTDQFDFKNQEHFKTYSLNFLKENIEKSWFLTVTYIRHLIKHKCYAQAVYLIEQTNKMKLNLARQLTLSYLKVELETILTSKHKKIKKDNLNLLTYIQMNTVYKDLIQLILSQIKIQMSFWDVYLSSKINFHTLVEISNQVENKKTEMKKFWRKYQLTAEEAFIAPYLTYSLYTEIANCLPAQSFDILTWYFRKVLLQERDFDKDELTNETLYGHYNMSVEISGSKENIGTVLHCSPSVLNVLGYDIKAVLGSQLSIMLPNCLKEHHNGFLLRHYETGKKTILDKTQKTFAQTCVGYILPIFLHIRLNPFLGTNISYISVIRPRTDKKNYLIVLPDGTVDGATEEIAQELQIPTAYKINIFDICPTFRLIHNVTNRIGAKTTLKTVGEMKTVGFGQTFQTINRRKTRFETFKDPGSGKLSKGDLNAWTTLASSGHLMSLKYMKEETLQTFVDKDIEGYLGLLTDEKVQELYSHYKDDGEELTFKNYQPYSKSARSLFASSKGTVSDMAQSTKIKVHVENMNYGPNWVRIVRIENFARLKSMYSLTKSSIGKTEEDLSEGHFSEAIEISPPKPPDSSRFIRKDITSITEFSSPNRLSIPQENEKILSGLVDTISGRGISAKINPKDNIESRNNMEKEFSKRSILKKITHQTFRGLETIDSFNNQLTQRKITFKPELVSPRDSEWRALNNEPEDKEDLVEIIKIKAAQKSEKVKNEKFKSIHEAASYYGSSQGRHRLSRHRAYENALEIKYRSSKITFFIVSFIVSMIAVVGILIAQMITADQVYQDVSKKHNVLHYNDKRTDALISTDYLVRTWQGVNKGMLGIVPPNLTLDPILNDLESSILSSVNILQGYGHDLLSDMSIIEIIFQEEFFIKNIKMYQLDDQGSPTYFELDDTFTGIAKVASHALELIVGSGSGSDTDTQNTVAADFVLFNSLNDLINQCSQATTIILDDVNYGVGKYKDSVWTRTAIIIVIIVMFLLISVSIIIKINNSVYVFSDFFFKVSNHDATLANESLKNFHKILSVEHQEEDLIASVQQIEQGWGQVKPNEQMKVSPKTIQFTNYKIANAFQILRLWPLVFCMLALISVFTVKQLAGINSTGAFVSHIIASLTNTLNLNLMTSLITEIVVANASTMVKNKPILTIFDTVIDTFAESNSLITAFMDADGKISDSYNELLFNVSCEAPFPYSVTTFPSNISLFREACYNLTNGLGSIGTIELNNMIYQDSNNYISNFMASPRTFQDQTEFFMKRDEVFSNLFTVAREINVQFWQTACDDFWGFLAVESGSILLLGGLILAAISVISALTFPISLFRLIEKDYELKRMVKLIPIHIILKNRWLKTYLTKTSKKALDAINKAA